MTTMKNPYERYREQGVMTAGPVELVIMLYDGCVKQLKLAKMYIEEAKLENAHKALVKGQDIINELLHGLDLQYDIALQLMKLYDYMLHEMVEVNIKKESARIDPLIEMLLELREAWVAVGKSNRTAYAMSD